LPEIIKKR